MRRTGATGTHSLVELPEYIITTFFPSARPLLDKNPGVIRFLGTLLAVWYLFPLTRLQLLWSRFSFVIIATINISSEEDLFAYLTSYIAKRSTLRADQALNATSNPPQESRRRDRHIDYEESGRRTNEDLKIKYEQSQGLQLFLYEKRLFFITRKFGEGYTYVGNRYKRIKILTLSCLGRSI